MQIPKRRGEVLVQMKKTDDAYLTPQAIEKMKRELEELKTKKRPKAIEESQRTAEMGDFSENVAYQIAKANLRRINTRMTILEERLKRAIPIVGGTDHGRIRIGSIVLLDHEGTRVTYTLVGSQEADPRKQQISHLSPLGALLMGHTVGETVTLERNGQSVSYTIVSAC